MKGFFVLLSLLISLSISAQKSVESEERVIPVAFQISQQPDVFEDLGITYKKGLLDVCKNDIKKAHQEWSNMLLAIESFATAQNFDINGVKMWLKVFWNNDGTIDHIAFHLKPTSKNIDNVEMQKFLQSFAASYSSRLESSVNYSQYSSAAFPILPHFQKIN